MLRKCNYYRNNNKIIMVLYDVMHNSADVGLKVEFQIDAHAQKFPNMQNPLVLKN